MCGPQKGSSFVHPIATELNISRARFRCLLVTLQALGTFSNKSFPQSFSKAKLSAQSVLGGGSCRQAPPFPVTGPATPRCPPGPGATCTLPVLQLEVQGVRGLPSWLWLLLQQAAGAGQILSPAGYMQGCITMLVLEYSAGSLQHQRPDDIGLVQVHGQMECCLQAQRVTGSQGHCSRLLSLRTCLGTGYNHL